MKILYWFAWFFKQVWQNYGRYFRIYLFKIFLIIWIALCLNGEG